MCVSLGWNVVLSYIANNGTTVAGDKPVIPSSDVLAVAKQICPAAAQAVFDSIDTDSSKTVSVMELQIAFEAAGHPMTIPQVRAIISQAVEGDPDEFDFKHFTELLENPVWTALMATGSRATDAQIISTKVKAQELKELHTLPT